MRRSSRLQRQRGKDGKWLQHAGAGQKILPTGEIPSEYPEMLSSLLVGHPDYLGGEFKPTPGEIHVLVKLPPGGHTIAAADLPPLSKSDGIHHPNRLKRWRELNEVLDGNKKAKVRRPSGDDDAGSSTAYSSITWSEVEKYFTRTRYKQEEVELGDARIQVLHEYLMHATTAFQGVHMGKQAKRLHFIAPILVCVSAHFDGDVRILVEESVDGSEVYAHGFSEFVIRRGDKRVCIVEAKRDDIDQGIAQDLVGCEIAR